MTGISHQVLQTTYAMLTYLFNLSGGTPRTTTDWATISDWLAHIGVSGSHGNWSPHDMRVSTKDPVSVIGSGREDCRVTTYTPRVQYRGSSQRVDTTLGVISNSGNYIGGHLKQWTLHSGSSQTVDPTQGVISNSRHLTGVISNSGHLTGVISYHTNKQIQRIVLICFVFNE